ncbi:hypothetical protein BASA81_002613 [Batrachochytrium salamandrivorans]|nr:hypothetical protein BASA81_002613 [Batrachochytrium salamandrivorans]
MLAARVLAKAAKPHAAAPLGARQMSWFPEYDPHDLPIVRMKSGAIVVNNVAWSLEWVLSSPPPLHSFLEPPIIVEWPEGEDGHDH